MEENENVQNAENVENVSISASEENVQVNETNETNVTNQANETTESVQPKKKAKVSLIALPLALIAIGVMSLCFFLFNSNAKAEWINNYDQALSVAKENKKEILLAFTGLGWDQISETLFTGDETNPGMLETSDFAKKLNNNFVLCHLDMPVDEEKITEEELEDLYTLAMIFNLNALPSFILLDAEGTPYATFPYSENLQNVDVLTEKIKEEKNNKAKIVKLKEKLEKANGTKKVEILDELFEIISSDEQSSLAETILDVPNLDPENKTGLVGKYTLIGSYAKAQSAMQTGNAEQAVKEFLEVAEKDVLEPVYKQEAYYMAAYVSFASGLVTTNEDKENILQYLQKAYDILPEGEAAEGISQTITSLKEADFDNMEGMTE